MMTLLLYDNQNDLDDFDGATVVMSYDAPVHFYRDGVEYWRDSYLEAELTALYIRVHARVPGVLRDQYHQMPIGMSPGLDESYIHRRLAELQETMRSTMHAIMFDTAWSVFPADEPDQEDQ